MKKTMGLAASLAVLILGSYYGMGYVAERKLHQALDVINQSNGITAKIAQYNRGWFKSKATIDWGLYIPEQTIHVNNEQQVIPARDYAMQVPIIVYHGPVIFANGIKFGYGYAHTILLMPKEYATRFDTLFTPDSKKPIVDLDFFVNYFGNSDIGVGLPAFQLKLKEDGSQFDWLGMHSRAKVSSDLNHVEGNINLEGMDYTKAAIKAQLSKLVNVFNLHRSEKGLFFGNANLMLASVLVSEGQKPLFELRQLDLKTDSNVKDNLFESNLYLSVGNLNAKEKNYGPGHVKLSFKNLDADTMVRLNEQIRMLQQAKESDRQGIVLAMLPEIPKLLGKGAQFKLEKLEFALPEGFVKGNLEISLPEQAQINPIELMQKTESNGWFEAPVAVVRKILTDVLQQRLTSPESTELTASKIEAQLQPTAAANAEAAVNSNDLSQQAVLLADKQLSAMLQNGLLVQAGENYRIDFNLSHGQFMLNGKPFNSTMLKLN